MYFLTKKQELVEMGFTEIQIQEIELLRKKLKENSRHRIPIQPTYKETAQLYLNYGRNSERILDDYYALYEKHQDLRPSRHPKTRDIIDILTNPEFSSSE